MRLRRAQGLIKLVMIGAAFCAAAAGAVLAFLWSRPAVTITHVIEGPVVQAFYATGTVQPRREYPINSNVAGIVEKVLVDKGNAVKVGQPLAVVTDSALVYAADRTKADLDQKRDLADENSSPVLAEFDAKIRASQENLEVAVDQEKRLKDLADRNAASRTDHDKSFEHMKELWSEVQSLKAQRAARLRGLQADLQIAQAAHKTALWNLDQQTLKSPIDGVVLDRPVSLGTRLEINGHAMQIADVRPGNLVMRAAVDEENIAFPQVKAGQVVKMTLYSFPGRTFQGKVSEIYPKADASRRTFEVDVTFDSSDESLRAGMTGELAFILEDRPRSLIVPAQAVQAGAVWTVRDGRLVKSDARLGIRSIERVEVASGMQIGDTVVISPVGGLKEGQAVRVGSTIDPKIAADLNKPKEAEVFKAFQ